MMIARVVMSGRWQLHHSSEEGGSHRQYSEMMGCVVRWWGVSLYNWEGKGVVCVVMGQGDILKAFIN